MALDFLNDFIDELQGYETHQPPKTMALVETQKFPAFVQAWENLSVEMANLFQTDADFNIFLRRARSIAIAFEGSLDGSAGSDPSALDIGSFMSSLRELCSPKTESTFNTLLVEAETTYKSMFVAQRVGEGTPPATGMHVLWPVKRVYQEDPNTYAGVLFETDLAFGTAFAPNFRQFLRFFYEFNGPITSSTEESICQLGAEPLEPPSEDEYLLLSPEIEIFRNRIDVTSGITASTDEVVVEYGIDISHFFADRLRSLRETLENRRLSLETDEISLELMKRIHIPRATLNQRKSKQRKLQNTDYFILFGGDLLGNYRLASYEASWDRTYYLIGDENNAEFAYAFSYQGGFKQIPVFYFPESISVTKDDIFLGAQLSDAAALGGVIGFVGFSTQEDGSTSSYVLYTFDENDRLSETSKTASGVIVPIILAEASLGNSVITVLVGGFSQAIIPWSSESTLVVEPYSAVEYMEGLKSNYAIVDVVAYDDDDEEDGIDFETFEIPLGELKDERPQSFSSASAPILALTWFLPFVHLASRVW